MQKELRLIGHEKLVCSCGQVIAQCRCMACGKPTKIVAMGCKRCREIADSVARRLAEDAGLLA